jgi:hypothetical protein
VTIEPAGHADPQVEVCAYFAVCELLGKRGQTAAARGGFRLNCGMTGAC